MAAEAMETLELAGRIIMENGGETYRVEETITRMGCALGLKRVESFAVPSGVFVSYRREDGATETSVVRVRRKGTNLTRVDEVNRISRQVEARELTAEEALGQLRHIDRALPTLPHWALLLGAAFSSGGFTLMFGGAWLDFLLAFMTTGLVQGLTLLMERRRMQGLASSLVGSFVSTLLPTLFYAWTGLGLVDAIVAGALMPLLPGLSMTNAVQDTLRGDMVSGVSHAVQALLTAALVAGGALMATSLCRMIGGV